MFEEEGERKKNRQEEDRWTSGEGRMVGLSKFEMSFADQGGLLGLDRLLPG